MLELQPKASRGAFDRRRFLGGMGVLALGATPLLQACSAGSTGNTSAKTTTLTIMDQYSSDTEKQAMITIAKNYETANPGTTVNLQSLAQKLFYQQLETRVAAGDPPDLAMLPLPIIPTYAAKNYYADLTQYLPPDFFSHFDQLRTQIDRPNGTIAGVPMADSVRAVIYNKTAFVKAGITAPGINDEPWTWDEMVNAAKAVQAHGGVTNGLMFEKPSFDGWIPFLFQNGGTLVDDKGDPCINNAAGVGALEWTQNLYKQKIAAPGVIEGTVNPLQLFESGQAGIWLSAGSDMAPALAKQVTNFEWGATFQPKQVKATTVIGGGDLIAFKGKNVAEAAKFIQFAAQPDQMLIYNLAVASLLPRDDAKNTQSTIPDIIDVFTTQAKKYLDPIVGQQILTPMYGAAKDGLLRELQSLVIFATTPQTAADNMNAVLVKAKTA